MSKLSEIKVKCFLSELSLKCVDIIENATKREYLIRQTYRTMDRLDSNALKQKYKGGRT
jgi:hypothetical protein